MHSPPKIKQIRILEDPFGDIIPRITAAEKRAQQLAKEQIQRERAEQGKRKQGRKSVSMDCRRIEANHSSEMQNFCHSAMMPMQNFRRICEVATRSAKSCEHQESKPSNSGPGWSSAREVFHFS